jgi:hypothetical protein
MLDRVFKFFCSLRLTVTLLALGIVLVFVGTIAQANEGLYQAQERYFKHWFVWGVSMFGYKVPIGLPGGYLIGTLLLINLTAAHIKRFQLTTKKLGIHLTHLGVILLLVGQLTTDLFSRETQLRFAEGESKVWSEDSMDYELAFATDLDADKEQVVAIPQSIVARGGEINHEKLPFTVKVKSYWPNSNPSFRAPMQDNAPPLTTNGVAQHFDFNEVPVTYDMDSKNVPVAILELTGPNGSLGTWVAPGWAGDETMSGAIRRSYFRSAGRELADSITARLTEPQSVEVGGKKYSFALRPTRAYKPFSITLLKTTHTTYPGRPDLPKDFRSRVRINNPQRSEDREVEIYMNSPLRYAGLTFFQHQMSAEQIAVQWGETPSSVLQVVRNPAWLTPYAGCIVVAAGLVIQFMIHLVGFISRRKAV